MNNFFTASMQDVGASVSVRSLRSGDPAGAKATPSPVPRDTKQVSHLARMMAAAKGEARVHSMGPERLAALRATDYHLTSLAQAILDEVGL